MTRLAAPPAASAICRHCGGAHSIAECPRVVAAFGPVRPTRNHPVKKVGPAKCPKCQKAFVRKQPTQKYCSRACYMVGNIARAAARRAARKAARCE